MAEVSANTTIEIQPGPKEATTGPGIAAPKQRHLLDIVFLQDSTGSQGSYIQACKAAITNICQKVSEHMGSPAEAPTTPSSSEPAIRFGLIAFRDHPPQDTSYVTKNFGFTSSVPVMKKWLGGLVASGGGDGPEASTAAMAEALNLEWRQSEEDEEGKVGAKVVKIVVLVTDAPPHGLGESGDGFPNGSPDQNDPLEIARQMAEHGISLYVIACEPSLSYYKHAVDFYQALTKITSGRMVPLLNASQLGDYIIGSALETLETEELIAQFQATILEDVYGQGKSVEEVVEKVQQQLQQQQVQMQTLQVDDVYAPSAQATSNVNTWMNVGKLGEAKGKVQEINQPRMKAEYRGSTAGFGGMGGFGGMPGSAPRTYASTPCGATPFNFRVGSATEKHAAPRASMPPPIPAYGSSAFGAPGGPLSAGYTGYAPSSAAPMSWGVYDAKEEASEEDDDDDDEMEEIPTGAASRGKGKAPASTGTRNSTGFASYAPPPPPRRGRPPPPAPARAAPSSYGAPAPEYDASAATYGAPSLPKVQMVQQAVSQEQAHRLVMQGLSRHAKVGPGGKLVPKGVWAKDKAEGDGGAEDGAMKVDGDSAK